MTDALGNVIVGEDWFYNENFFEPIFHTGKKLYARWKPTKEVPKYKILMIYVTEIEADLEFTDGEIIPVHYKMTENEKKMCEMLSSYLEEYLEAMLNSTVDFEVDSYYTKEVLRTEQFYRGITTWPGDDKLAYVYGIDPKQNMIPEVYEILDNYDSVITSFSMNDYDLNLHITGGSGEKKYANIHLEFMFHYFYDDCPSECIFDFEYPGVYRCWISFMETYIHEFIHTVEMQLRDEDNYGLHNIAKYYSDYVGPINIEFDFQNLFKGIVKCENCGRTLTIAYHIRRNGNKVYELRCMGKYLKHGTDKEINSISYQEVYDVVNQRLHYLIDNIKKDGHTFIENISHKREEKNFDETLAKEKNKIEKRLSTIAKIVKKLYEDYIVGNLSSHNYQSMLMDYQKEQNELNAQLEEINTKLNKSLSNKEESLIRFKGNVSEYLDYKELTIEMINNLIDHIIIGHPKIVDGEKVRTIEIVYRFIN